MADYYSILKKTIASLPENNGAARRSVYSRARNAIVNQLKAYEPPLAPSEITAEQLRLEEAIRKVEAEAARESLGLGPVAPKVEPAAPVAPVAAPAAAAPGPEAAEVAPAPAVHHEPDAEPAAEPADATIPSPLKDTLDEAQTLGGAASQAVQNAKDAVEPHTEPAAAVRQEPAFGNQPQADDGLFEPEEEPLPAGGSLYAEDREPAEAPAAKKSRSKRNKPSASDSLRDSGGIGRLVPIAAAAALLLGVVGGGAYYFLTSDENVTATRPSGETPDSQTATNVQPPAETPGAAPVEDDDAAKNTDRLLNDGDTDVVAPDARTVTTTTITPQADAPAPAPSQPSIVSSADETQPPGIDAPVPPATEPEAVPEDNLTAISPDEPPAEQPVATENSGVQRSILYEEGEETGGAGTAAQGAVVWNIEEETNLDGKAQAVLSASVEVPERDIKVDIRIKPNDDTSLPASHLVEIKYEFPEDFAAGDIVNVPGLVMKPTEEARGDALIGASVKVSPGFFWIALSSLPNEQQRNLALLRERGWIDIPMLYENGKRGILTLEKGTAGADAVEKAISAWQAG
ncbi:hypothetical protein [Roseibium sp. M-1]